VPREIIVTDLTRLKKDKVCLAGIDPINAELIRPTPYLDQQECITRRILPGSKIRAEFVKIADAKPPHVEDYQWKNWNVVGSATSAEFHDLLAAISSPSICEGFGIEINDKCIPVDSAPGHSIITVKTMVKLHSGYGNDLSKIKATITDAAGLALRYLTVNDFRFYQFAQEKQSRADLAHLNKFINSQSEIFIRLGLTRFYNTDGRSGYWLQINGIYTFPDFFESDAFV